MAIKELSCSRTHDNRIHRRMKLFERNDSLINIHGNFLFSIIEKKS